MPQQLTESDWAPIPQASSPEQFSWISRNKVDIPAAAVGSLAGAHGAVAGWRDARKKKHGRAASALRALILGGGQGVAGYLGTQAARRGAGRVITNLVAPFEYDNPAQAVSMLRGRGLTERAKLMAQAVWKDKPLDLTLDPSRDTPVARARLGMWDAYWGRSPRRAGDLFTPDPGDSRRLRVNPTSTNVVGSELAKATADDAAWVYPGAVGAAADRVTGNHSVTTTPSGVAAMDDWWDISNHRGGSDSGVQAANPTLRALATVLGRPKMLSVRVPPTAPGRP